MLSNHFTFFCHYSPITSKQYRDIRWKKGKKAAFCLIHIPYGKMGGETSVPLSIAAEMLIKGKIPQKGGFFLKL
ncbi:MAG: hypothetical protein ACTSWY_11870 [Promethearchaeota archaeon]